MITKRRSGQWVTAGLLALLIALPARTPAEEPKLTSATELKEVAVEHQPDATIVHITTSGAAKYHAEFMDSPSRLVVDLEDTVYAWRKAPLPVTEAPVKQIRGAQYRKGIARLVIEFTRKVGYAIREDEDGLTIVVPRVVADASTAPKPLPLKSPVVAEAPAEPKNAPSAAPAEIKPMPVLPAPVKPAPIPRPAARVVAQAPAQAQAPAPAPTPVVPPPAATGGPHLISLDFKDADVVNLLRILAAESGRNIVIGDDVKGKMSISLRNVAWDLALDTIMEARGLVKTERDNVIRIVSADQLAKERESKARVEEAKLKAEADVRTKVAEAQLKEAEARGKMLAAEAAAAEVAARGPLKEETIRLAYADPEELAKTLSGILGIPEGGAAPAAVPAIAPIPAPPFSAVFGPGAAPPPLVAPAPSADVLAKGITIRAHKPTNSIFIRHYANDLERIKKLIRENLDIPLPQVKIEARLNEINRTDLFEIGVQWGGAGARRDGSNVLVGQGFAPFSREGGQQITRAVDIGQRAGGVETLTGFGGAATAPSSQITSPITNPLSPLGLAQLLPVSSLTGLPLGGNAVNLLPSNLPTGGISFGLIGTNFNLNLALQALEESSKTRSLSKPEIVTVENAKASIALGSEIPYATVSSAGTQVQFKDALLKLDVTPTVIREAGDITRVKMLVNVENNSKGDDINSAAGPIPSINRRTAITQVVVKEGETLAIGGIRQHQSVESTRKVPFFGDIPVLGFLFRTKSTLTDPNRELVVFITPYVLKLDLAQAPATSQPKK